MHEQRPGAARHVAHREAVEVADVVGRRGVGVIAAPAVSRGRRREVGDALLVLPPFDADGGRGDLESFFVLEREREREGERERERERKKSKK